MKAGNCQSASASAKTLNADLNFIPAKIPVLRFQPKQAHSICVALFWIEINFPAMKSS